MADEGDLQLFLRYLSYSADVAPVNSPYEFLAFCGTVGLGRLVAEGMPAALGRLRGLASDPRWRVREAVAMGLQRLGSTDMEKLLAEMELWSKGTPLEQRAAAAALCEPKLLSRAEHARSVLHILDGITSLLERMPERKGEEFAALRKGLGYCWSVAVAALPDEGKMLMEQWLVNPDKDVQWIMKENLKKERLIRMDSQWVEKWRDKSSFIMKNL